MKSDSEIREIIDTLLKSYLSKCNLEGEDKISLDSVLAVNFVVELENCLGIEMKPDELRALISSSVSECHDIVIRSYRDQGLSL